MDFVREIDDAEAESEVRKMFTSEEWQRLPEILKTRFKNKYKSERDETFKRLPELTQKSDKHVNCTINKSSFKSKTAKSENKSSRQKVMDTAVGRYPKCKGTEVNNFKLKQANKDNFVTCNNCQEQYLDFCLRCASLVVLKDFPVSMGTEDRAEKTLPRGVLEIRQSQIHGNGVFTTSNVMQGVQLGPYEGQLTRVETTNGYSYKLREGRLPNREEINSEYYSCQGCCMGFSTETFRSSHEKICELNPRRMKVYNEKEDLKCQFCVCTLSTKKGLKKHESMCSKGNKNRKNRTINGSGEKKKQMFYCNYCGYETKQKQALNEHISAIHKKKISMLLHCDECKFSTYYKDSFRNHLRRHSENAFFTCESCQKGFTQKMNLDSHIFSNHKDLHHLITRKIYKCKLCKYATLQTTSLRTHNLNHSKENAVRYQCQKCEYATYRKVDLSRHLLGHSNLKPYICKKCKKDFVTKQALDSHIINNHKDEADLLKTITSKIHRCPDCEFKTVITSCLNSHKKKHY